MGKKNRFINVQNLFDKFSQDRFKSENNFFQIRGGIIFCESLPRNSMGKLLRREARANALKQIQPEMGSI